MMPKSNTHPTSVAFIPTVTRGPEMRTYKKLIKRNTHKTGLRYDSAQFRIRNHRSNKRGN